MMFCQEERNGEGKFKKIKNKYYSFPLIAPFNPHSPIHGHSQPLILARLSTPPPTAPPNKCAHCVVILGSTKLEEITTKSAPATKVFDEGLAKEDIFILLDSCFMDPLCLHCSFTSLIQTLRCSGVTKISRGSSHRQGSVRESIFSNGFREA